MLLSRLVLLNSILLVDTSRSPVHNIPCLLHWVRDRYHQLLHHCHVGGGPNKQSTRANYWRLLQKSRQISTCTERNVCWCHLNNCWACYGENESTANRDRHLHHHHMLSRMTGYLSSLQEVLFEKCSEAIIWSLHPNNYKVWPCCRNSCPSKRSDDAPCMQEEYAERISEAVNRLITENITTALVNAGHITHRDIA